MQALLPLKAVILGLAIAMNCSSQPATVFAQAGGNDDRAACASIPVDVEKLVVKTMVIYLCVHVLNTEAVRNPSLRVDSFIRRERGLEVISFSSDKHDDACG